MKNKLKSAIILRGLPASGKTTYAINFMEKYTNYKRVNKDDLRKMIDNGVYSPQNEELIKLARNAIITLILDSGYSLIIDDTNLDPKSIQEIKEVINDKAEIIIKDFSDIPLDECIKRDSLREKQVGKEKILYFNNKYLR